jgi:hypothetical protein
MGASTNKIFNSQVKDLCHFAIGYNDVKNEPMFFNCDLDFAFYNGGDITKSFIDNLPEEWQHSKVVFDSRIHMLMPGWYPAIPGYHHDDVPRKEIPTGQHFLTAGQPDYDNPRYYSQHIMGLVNAHICPTHFALGECEMPAIPEGEMIYKRWNDEVENLLAENKLDLYEAPDRTLLYFDCDTFHTGTKAINNGWRWFGRVSRYTDRVNKITNEIRHQVQVYLEFPTEGW